VLAHDRGLYLRFAFRLPAALKQNRIPNKSTQAKDRETNLSAQSLSTGKVRCAQTSRIQCPDHTNFWRRGWNPGPLLMTRKLLIFRDAAATLAAGTARSGYSLGTGTLQKFVPGET
jgi:hypothetical protein